METQLLPSAADSVQPVLAPSEDAPRVERRRKPRVVVSKLAMVEEPDAPPTPAVIMDISETGTLLRAPRPARPDVRYLMHLKLDGASYAAPFMPVHSYAEAGHYMWGCEFSNVTTEH